jgi:UDP-N-acetylglucosamine--N-acetylmuramyl-(pentapeptide) pyrophosphoryl-undecaprenol N-acetylglucosamine transferase
VPTLVHEQNAVLGRVNRLLARRVALVATAYRTVDRLPGAITPHIVGNPVREEILDLRDRPYPPLTEDGVFRLLVTGGSQGASILSTVVPDALGLLPLALRERLQVTQQCRPEDIDAVRARYAELDIACDTATYIEDMPGKLAWAHLFVGRSGASTIAELTAAGRPAILVPLPSATDDHQTANAREMAASGGAAAMPQSTFTPQRLAKQMQKMALEPGALENAARRAKDAGYPHATADLADLVEGLVPPVEAIPARVKPARPASSSMKEAFA